MSALVSRTLWLLLDVNGSIRLGPSGTNYATGSRESLRIVRGVCNSTGGTVSGSGFYRVVASQLGRLCHYFQPRLQ